MDVLILRLLLDSSFFLAIFYPLIIGNNPVFKLGLPVILAAWLVWICLNWKKKDLEGRVHDVALLELKILAGLQIYELVILGFAKWQNTCAGFVVFFGVTMILFLRAGRLIGGSQEKKKFWGANGVELAAILGLTAILASDLVKSAAWKLLGGFYMKLVFPILMALLSMFQMFLMVVGPFIASFFSKVEYVDNGIEVDNRTGQDFLQLTGNEALVEVPVWAKVAGALLVAAGLFAFLYFLYKKLSGGGSGRDRAIRGEVKKSSLGAAEKGTGKKHSLFEEKNVRYYYRKFLENCRKRDLWPEAGMVTSEMMRRIVIEESGNETAIDDLTDLYRDVRYGGKAEEENDRKQAKHWMKQIKETLEQKRSSEKS